MKKIGLGLFMVGLMISCGGATEADIETTDAPEIDAQEVIKMETATDDVVNGLEELEHDVENMSNDIDSLLNGI